MSTRARFVLSLASALLVAGPPAQATDDWDRDWVVMTMAKDGAWGVGVDRYLAKALATAVRDCRAMTVRRSNCGSNLIATRSNWIIGVRCGDYNILASGSDLKAAEVNALYREIDLKQLYAPHLTSCRRALTVDPRGGVTVEASHERASRDDGSDANNGR